MVINFIVLASMYMSGQEIYNKHCIQCHGNAGVGLIGPRIKDSSLEVLKSKVLTGKYPPGYTPKRKTRAMPVFKNLRDQDVEKVYKYLKK
jgi:mono/diheme cytochrome c family protein